MSSISNVIRFKGNSSRDLDLCHSNVDAEGLREVSKLTALTSLGLVWCPNVTTEGLRAINTLPKLTTLDLKLSDNVDAEGLRELSKITSLTKLDVVACRNVTDEAIEALRTALPNLTLGGF